MKKIDYRFISMLLYSIITFIITIYHEPFKNEAQAWLIVRDLDLPGIINMMWYEGTPALWHLMIFPLVKLGLPYLSMQLLHWVIAVLTVLVILYKSPFPPVLKILLSFSFYFLYEFSSVARNYSITVLIMMILAVIWSNKHKLPVLFCVLVILLINSNLIIWGFGAVITLLYLYDNRHLVKKINVNHILTIIILLSGFLLVLFQIIPRSSSDTHGVVSFSFLNVKFPKILFIAPANALITGETDSSSMIMPFYLFTVFIFMHIVFIKKPLIMIAAAISEAWCYYLFMFIYQGSARHHAFLLIIYLFFLWIHRYYKESNRVKVPEIFKYDNARPIVLTILALCLFTSIVRTVIIIPKEIKNAFSGSKEIAEYIQRNDFNDYTWIGHQSEKCEAILPYFSDKKFWYADIQDYGSYIIWDSEFKENSHITEEEIFARINSHFSGQDNLLLIMSKPLVNPEKYNFKLIYENQEKIFWIHDEHYYLYLPLDDNTAHNSSSSSIPSVCCNKALFSKKL